MFPQVQAPRSESRPQGFALVVTISLLTLLTLLGVALLSLSTISLRQTSRASAQNEAQANARLALELALGDLQRLAGPDQRITARADILDDGIARPRLTGVWNSWEIKATAPPRESDYGPAAKKEKFAGWLVSSADAQAARESDFARQPAESPVTLIGSGTLGEKAPAVDHVQAGLVPLDNGMGAAAWAVFDEGIKARINTGFVADADSVAAKTAQLGSGQRPAAELLPGLDSLKRPSFALGSKDFETISKGISGPMLDLANQRIAPGAKNALAPLTHDVTPYSLGLFTNVARGGLKDDFHLLTNGPSLPSGFAGTGVYRSRLHLGSVPSDPRWESLYEFSTLYRDGLKESNGVPLLHAQWPSGWRPATQTGGNPPRTTVDSRPPPGAVLMPTVAKVQMVFSLVGRDLYAYSPPVGRRIPINAPSIHYPQADHFRGTPYQYDLHLLYTPVVTLHNPYNVALEFYKLRVDFVSVPFAATVYRNGRAQNTGLAPMDRMYGDNDHGERGPKHFGLNLKTRTSLGHPGSPTFRLMPGETKLFSPYIDPNRTYRQDLNDRKFWDIYVGTGLTDDIDAIPGWRGDGIGFDLDWWNPSDVRIPGPDKAQGRWLGALGLSGDDRIHIEFAPRSDPRLSDNKFVVTISAARTPSEKPVMVNAIELDYEEPDGLQRLLLDGDKTIRFPEGSGSYVRGFDLIDHSTTPIKNLLRVRPFALMTVEAKTTSGGRDPSHVDGRNASMPWCFAHAPIGVSSQRLLHEHPAAHSHEIDLRRLDNGTTDVLELDTRDRTNFITGHTPFNGTKFGALYDIPLHPLQAFSTLNGANPGGASGYLPRFAQPIGNSWANPLLPSDRLASGALADHSFLLNLALYDDFYFSGLADHRGPFGDGKASADLASEFVAGQPLDDPRLVFHHPDQRPTADFIDEVGQNDAHSRIAAWQTLRGAFNINSTSVLAWKAMLGSIHGAGALVNELDKSDETTRLVGLPAAGAGEARISRFRLPASFSTNDGANPQDAYWLGPREFSDEELETLATEIVEQVRSRGPFLSMAEFVNRQLGSDERAQAGALQQAIDTADLNRDPADRANAGFEIGADAVADYDYANPDAAIGPSYRGAPGFLSQSDLLDVLGNAATPRSDTFTIRAYGESRVSEGGPPAARAWCEAVVQRLPEWIDPADRVETPPEALSSETNKTFGRRFHIISFRWLHPDEI